MTVRAADADALALAGRLIREGRLVAFPTETVYGLGADATRDEAVARIFAAKDRPSFNPLIIHVADAEAAQTAVEFDVRARRLAEAFWPGPLTLVLPRKPEAGISLLAGAGLATLGVRVPDHPVALALLRAARRPLAAPSANRSGAVSPTTAAHVAEGLGAAVDLVLDGGPCRVGIESTVLALDEGAARLLRPGGVSAEAIRACIGPLAPAGSGILSPGMLERHYAPGLPLRLNVDSAFPGEALLAFGPELPQYAPAATLNLSPVGDVVEAAANLFAMLHALDRSPHQGIAVMRIPMEGLGRALNDRLRRASADRAPETGGPACGCRAVVDPFDLGD